MSVRVGPVVSVIIPTYYRNESLRNAIHSALCQGYDPIEVIVIDDSGVGHARTIAEDYGDIEYIAHDSNKGAAAARATGLSAANGDVIQFLDDDDFIYPDKIEAQLRVLNQRGVGVVYSGISWPQHESYPSHRGDVLKEALEFDMPPCCTPTMLVEADVLDSIKPFGQFPGAQDIWLIVELAKRTKFEYVNEILVSATESDSHLHLSPVTGQNVVAVVDHFESLYEDFPDEVRSRAMRRAYQMRGDAYINNRRWSFAAVVAYWKAFRRDPDRQPLYFIEFLSSLLGRYGMKTTSALVERISK